MVENQRLSDRLGTLIDDYGPENLAWYHFVRDHKDYLKRKSSTRRYTPESLLKYRYRPVEFYHDEMNGETSMTWIFLFVNDIRSIDEFNESRNKFIMVQPDDIKELLRVYLTSANYAYEQS